MPHHPTGYSEGALTQDLRRWWDEKTGGDDPFADSAPIRAPETIFDVVPEIDSLSMIEGLVTAEKHVGFPVPPRLVRRGGYGSFDEMIDDLLPKLRNKAMRRAGTREAA